MMMDLSNCVVPRRGQNWLVGFNMLASSTRLSADDRKGLATECEPTKSVDEGGGDGVPALDEESDGKDDGVDPMDWCRSSLFDDLVSAPQKPPPAKAPQGKPKVSQPKGSSGSASSGGASTLAATTLQPHRPADDGNGGQQSGPLPSVPRKFQGKSPEDILAKYNWVDLDAQLIALEEKLSSADLAGRRQGDEVATTLSTMKKQAHSVHKAMVALDIKVQKWTGTPPGVTDLLKKKRGRAKVILDAALAFSATGKHLDATKMETAKAEMATEKMTIPGAFHLTFFKEKSLDFIRFRCMGEFIDFIGGEDSYLKESFFAPSTVDLRSVRADVVSSGLHMLVSGCAEGDEEAISEMRAFVKQLTELEDNFPNTFESHACGDLKTLGIALTTESTTSAHEDAIAKLSSITANDDYAGILREAIDAGAWSKFLDNLTTARTVTANISQAIARVQGHVAKFGEPAYTRDAKDRDEFYKDFAAMVIICVDMGGDDCPRGQMDRLLQSITLQVQHGATQVAGFVEEALQILVSVKSKSLMPLEAHSSLESLKLAACGAATQFQFNSADLLKHVAQQKVHQFMENFAVAEGWANNLAKCSKMIEIVSELLQLRKVVCDLMTQATDEILVAMVDKFNCIHSLLSDPRVQQTNLTDLVKALENECGVGELSAKLYRDGFAKFQVQCKAFVQLGLDCLGGAANAGEVEGQAKVISDLAFQMLQRSSASATPIIHRAAIDFFANHVTLLCCRVPEIIRLKTKPPSDYVVDSRFKASLEAALNAEDSKPKLQPIIADMSDKFLDMLASFKNILAPVEMKFNAVVNKRLTAGINKLKTLLVDDETEDDVIYKKLTTSKVDAMRKIRRELLEASEQSKAGGASTSEAVVADELAIQARLQSVRFGFLAFLNAPHIHSQGEEGSKIRKNLKSIWDMSQGDDILQYLAKYSSKSVEEIKVLVDMESTPAAGAPKGRVAAKKRAATSAPGDPPKAKRKC
ncbi:unnamed protein product [Prorocentrum cordatum]|uniref:Exocyst complex component Sec6 n=1 Tax=Prorocentrum cordatum TaxID=2364126 RepID=A0ABN9T7W7_9DINO|nr:unnamed protein product [Polarella glacialis]